MYYENIDEFIDANTAVAREIIKKIPNEDEREELEDTLDFLCYKVKEYNNIIKWMEDATHGVVGDSDYKKIMELFMTFMQNDFIVNTEFGRELARMGEIQPSGFTFFANLKED